MICIAANSDNIVNLTPHDVVVYDVFDQVKATFAASGKVARANSSYESEGSINGIELVHMTYGKTVDLPPHDGMHYYIVSALTANAAAAEGRRTDDLLLTADPVRDDAGHIIGCRRFARL